MSCPLPQLLVLSARPMAVLRDCREDICPAGTGPSLIAHLIWWQPHRSPWMPVMADPCQDGLWGKHRPCTSKEITPPPLVLNCCFKGDSRSAVSWHRRGQSLSTPKWLFHNKDNIGGIAVGNFLRKFQLVKYCDYK